MPAEDLNGQRVWSRKMLLVRATSLEKTQLYFHLLLKKKRKKGRMHQHFQLPVQGAMEGTLPNAHGEPAADPSFFLHLLDPPNHPHLCCFARDRDKENFAGHWGQALACITALHLPQGFSCGKCRASSSCSFIRVAHTECPSFPKQLRFLRHWCIYMWEMTAIEWEVQTLKEKGKEKLLFLRQSLKIIVKCRRKHFSLDVGFAVWSTWDPKANIKFFRWSLFMLPAQQQVSHNTR